MYVMKKRELDLVLLAESFKAIAHPDRIRILALLTAKSKINICVTELCEQLKLAQPEVSRHLAILKNKGILVFERSGSNVYYSINRTNAIFNCIENLFSK